MSLLACVLVTVIGPLAAGFTQDIHVRDEICLIQVSKSIADHKGSALAASAENGSKHKEESYQSSLQSAAGFSNGLPTSVKAAISVTDLALAAAACWVVFTAWRSKTSTPSLLLGASTNLQVSILLGFISLSVAHMFLQHRAGNTGYSVISATLLIYVGKMIVSFLMFLSRGDVTKGIATLWAPGTTRFGKIPAFLLPMVPGACFAAYDALSFVSLQKLDPVTYQILLYLRVTYVGILWQVMFQRKLSTTKWLAIFVFVAAGITKSLDHAQTGSANFHFGILVVFIQTLISAFANVASEVLLKEMPLPTDLNNTVTYAWGFFWLVVAMICREGHGALFTNFLSMAAWERLHQDAWMIGSIWSLIALGITTAYLLKELNNIVKELSGGFVIVSATCMQWATEGNLGSMSWIGVGMALLAVLTYSSENLQGSHSRT